MIEIKCTNCGQIVRRYPSTVRLLTFCDKSCHRSYKNTTSNPSKTRDLSGENNPMWGKHIMAWNKGKIGEESHNWKGGIHKRKDGYIRVRVNGKRYLQHRLVVQDQLVTKDQVVHHIDGNHSNNHPSNLLVIENQAEHARLHKLQEHAIN